MTFIRVKRIKGRAYLYLVKNKWTKDGSRQRVVKYLGKWDGETVINDFVFQRDEFKCRLCGSKENLTIDHMIPVSLGGGNLHENVWTLCSSCNQKKRTGVVIDGEIIQNDSEELRIYTQLQMLIQGFSNDYKKRKKALGKKVNEKLMLRTIKDRKIIKEYMKKLINSGYTEKIKQYL